MLKEKKSGGNNERMKQAIIKNKNRYIDMNKKIGRIIDLKKIVDPRGNLTVIEGETDVPFAIQRVYWVYDVPAGEYRGGHAHKNCRELLVALSGSFQVTIDNGTEKETYLLNHPYQGLLIEAGLWRTLDDFSSGAVCMVLASDPFEEEDYIREYGNFVKSKKVKR